MIFGFAACEMIEGIGEAIEACDGMTLDELRTVNDISDECRAALMDILPSDENYLAGIVVSAGIGNLDGNKLLIIMGADENGNPINLSDVSEITVTADGQTVPESSYIIRQAADLSATIVSLSCFLDYSGSMHNKDIDDAIEVFKSIFSIPVGFEAEYSIFSKIIEKKTTFTTNTETLYNAVVRDNYFIRSYTALFDAMGYGIQSVGGRNAPVKLLIVATDGHENNSTEFTQENTLYSMANEDNVHIIVLGAMLADLDFMERATQSTDGFYLYSKEFGSLQNLVQDLVDVLGNMPVVEITDDLYKNASAYLIYFDGTTLSF